MHFHFFLFNESICYRYEYQPALIRFPLISAEFYNPNLSLVKLSVNMNWAYLEGQMQEIRPPSRGKREMNGNHSCSEARTLQDSSRSSSRQHSSEQRGVK